jgi:BirA family biotin operon repressor/biotin-[acetyl-CoA-carboxylase] ligase
MGPMDASRDPLRPDQLGQIDRWRVEVVAATESTNADLLTAAALGAEEGIVRVAEFQSGGRGRLDRSWSSPVGAGLTFSMLIRPRVPLPTWGWLPLLTGLALAQAIGGDARLKWPNDLLLGPDGGKAAGILLQTGDGAAVVGVGLNVTTTRAELPVDTATSLALERISRLDRAAILTDFLAGFGRLYADWQDAAGDAEASGLADGYRTSCATLRSTVSVQQPSGELVGDAVGIDSDGRLLVRPSDSNGTVAVAAGDVTHLRSISR